MDYPKLAEVLYPNISSDIRAIIASSPIRTLCGGAEVVRFAPSPTGYLHIGSFYQAYLNRLIADSTGGVFYLRLEDTDRKRLVSGSDKVALDMLKFYDTYPDEGYLIGGDYAPYAQSERLDIYHTFAKYLVSIGRAYPCFCGENSGKSEILEKRKNIKETVKFDPCKLMTLQEIEERLGMGQKFGLAFISNGSEGHKVKVKDVIKGEREIGENTQDVILIKSNNIPVYAFAHVVDDTLMRTTLVVRGEEWFSSLNVHLQLFEAFGLTPTKYAHTPLLMKVSADGRKGKFSKRDGEADMRYYIEKGYPQDAVKEYLLTLINSSFENARLANPKTKLSEFKLNIKNIGISNPLFDMAKLDNISKRVISNMSVEELYNAVYSHAKTYDAALADEMADSSKWKEILGIDRAGAKPRKDIAKYSDIADLFIYFTARYRPAAIDTVVTKDTKNELLSRYSDTYTQHDDNVQWFDHLKSVAMANGFGSAQEYKLSPADFVGDISEAAKIIRVAITGMTNSPTLFSIMKVLGVNEVKNRLKNAIK